MFTCAFKKLREMDWQLVAIYFTVKSTDTFLQCTEISKYMRGSVNIFATLASVLSCEDFSSYTAKNIRRFYDKITGN